VLYKNMTAEKIDKLLAGIQAEWALVAGKE
jgi:hypothetical protein